MPAAEAAYTVGLGLAIGLCLVAAVETLHPIEVRARFRVRVRVRVRDSGCCGAPHLSTPCCTPMPHCMYVCDGTKMCGKFSDPEASRRGCFRWLQP